MVFLNKSVISSGKMYPYLICHKHDDTFVRFFIRGSNWDNHRNIMETKKILEHDLMFLLWSLLWMFVVPPLLAWLCFGAILVLG